MVVVSHLVVVLRLLTGFGSAPEFEPVELDTVGSDILNGWYLYIRLSTKYTKTEDHVKATDDNFKVRRSRT